MPWKSLKDELKLSNFGLDHPKPYIFVTSQWPCRPTVYLVYRFFSMTYFVTLTVMSGTWDYEWYTSASNRIKWFIYITHWSLVIFTLSTILQSVLVAHAQCAGTEHTPLNSDLEVFLPLPWYLKVNWVLYNLSINSTLVVAIEYWMDANKGARVHGRPAHEMQIGKHLTPCVYVTIDLLVVATPIRIYHVIHGIIVAIIYVSFSYVFVSVGGTNSYDESYIYSVQDWGGDFQTAALTTAGIVLIITPGTWLILFAMYKLRLLIYGALYPEPEEKNEKLEN